MTPIQQSDENRLLVQVLGFVGLLLVSFAENGLGYFPALYGSVPKLAMIVLFILCLKVPLAMPLVTVFSIGLIHDLVQANPLGHTSALMVLLHLVAQFRQPVLQQAESGAVWYEFTILMLVLMVLTIMALLVHSGTVPALQPLLFQFGLTVLIFPVINWVFELLTGFAAMVEKAQ